MHLNIPRPVAVDLDIHAAEQADSLFLEEVAHGFLQIRRTESLTLFADQSSL
jgi:hypothetical protein